MCVCVACKSHSSTFFWILLFIQIQVLHYRLKANLKKYSIVSLEIYNLLIYRHIMDVMEMVAPQFTKPELKGVAEFNCE